MKVGRESDCFAARWSDTEEVSKIYAESFRDADHLGRVQAETQEILAQAFAL